MEISEEFYKAQVRLSDVAQELGNDWQKLAVALGVPGEHVERIRREFDSSFEQALEMLFLWTRLPGVDHSGVPACLTVYMSSCLPPTLY